MGCGESKHDVVAFGNTILRRKQSSKKSNSAKNNVNHDDQDQKPTAEITASDENHALLQHHAKDVVNKDQNDVESTVIEAKEVPKEDQPQTKTDETVDGSSINPSDVIGDQGQKTEDHDQKGESENMENVVKEEEKPETTPVKLEVSDPAPEEEKPETTPVELEVSDPVPEEEKPDTTTVYLEVSDPATEEGKLETAPVELEASTPATEEEKPETTPVELEASTPPTEEEKSTIATSSSEKTKDLETL